MQDLLEYIVKKLTGEEATVSATSENNLNVYTIRAPKAVMGLLIGKGGKTIHAIRALARARAIKDQENINLVLEEV